MIKSKILVFMSIFSTSMALAQQQGIAVGEPDPNTSPGHDNMAHSEKTLVDDRKPCPQGLMRFPKLHCVLPAKSKPACENYTQILECAKKASHPQCKSPQTAMPIYRCD